MSHMEGVEGVVRYQRKPPCFIAVLHSFTFCCPLEGHKMPQYFLAIFLQLHCNLLLTIVLGYRFCMFYTTLGSYRVSIHCLLHNSLMPLLFHPCHFISLHNLYFYMNISKVLIKLTKKIFPICYFAIRWSAFFCINKSTTYIFQHYDSITCFVNSIVLFLVVGSSHFCTSKVILFVINWMFSIKSFSTDPKNVSNSWKIYFWRTLY